jgi:predicted nuclease of predicted toxin-antitoxin system
MNFLADESVDRQIVDGLRQEGHRVWYIAEMDPGISDDVVLNIADREIALLLTADKDFGEIIFRQHRFAPGVILIRLAGLSQTQKTRTVIAAINKHTAELPQAFTVITPKTIRIRRQSS